MKWNFFLPNYSCFQDPWLGGYRPQIPVLSVYPHLNLLNPPPNKIPVYATDHINCKNDIEQMISKLSGSCYAIKLMVPLSNINTLKSIYNASFHSVCKYGIIFGGKRFILQNKLSECQYILSLMNFIINNKRLFQTNSCVHNINTRNKHRLHRPNTILSCYQKSTFYAGINIFNSLPPSVTILKNDKAKFQAAFRKFLHILSFYSVDKFFMHKDGDV
jgi:hypothetical protein